MTERCIGVYLRRQGNGINHAKYTRSWEGVEEYGWMLEYRAQDSNKKRYCQQQQIGKRVRVGGSRLQCRRH